MNKDFLEKLSKKLTQEQKKKVELISSKKIDSGYHSDGYKLTSKDGKNYFLKKFKSDDLGFYYNERKIYSLMVSNSMASRVNAKPKPISVILEEKNNVEFLDLAQNYKNIYHLQEYTELGKSYTNILSERESRKSITGEDIEELKQVVKHISKVHKVKPKDNGQLRNLYNDGIQSVLISPELLVMMLGHFEDDHKIMPIEKQREFILTMYDLIRRYRNNEKRVSALHGDFWGNNVFFNKGKINVIDYSRIPWGDPGIDVGWWIAQYLYAYSKTGNNYFKELTLKFLELYIKETGDKDILEHTAIIMPFQYLVLIFPPFELNPDEKVMKKFKTIINGIIEEGKIKW